MNVELLHFTPLSIAAHATRTCHQSFDKAERDKDVALLMRVGNELKHKSVLEHLVYTFYIQGISRACLQELARHRMASLSVKSTRYTLKELTKAEPFIDEGNQYSDENAGRFVVFTGNSRVDSASVHALEVLRSQLLQGKSNDIVKYCLPESFKTELTWTINARSLQNFLKLRSSKAALEEIRKLAYEVFGSVPKDHKKLFESYLASWNPKEERADG